LGLSWTDARDGNTEIYFTVLDRTGRRRASQIANLRITQDANRSESSRLIWAGDGYALSWTDNRQGDFDVYFATLTSTGTKTSADVPVARGSSSDLALTFDGFGVVWQSATDASGQQIYFALLDQDGVRLSEGSRLSDIDESGSSPRVAFDGGTFGVAWQSGPGGGELRWSRLDLAGELLDAAEAIGQTSGDAGALSLLQQPDGGFGMAFASGSAGYAQVMFLELDDAGQLQGESMAVSDGLSAASAPALIMTGDGYAAAWVEASGVGQSRLRFRLFCAD
jgi:hypothetical protein